MEAHVRFLHTSDLQIGMTRWFLDRDGQALFDDSRINALRRLGEVALEHECEFIVVAGDVFESNSLSDRTTGRVLDVLRSLPVPVYLLPGNHDPLTADSIFYRVDDIDGVTVLAHTSPIQIRPGVEIVGAPLLTRTATTDLVRQALEPLEPSPGIRILVGHGQVDSYGSRERADFIDLDYAESRLRDGTVDYIAMGDTHSTAEIGTTGRMWFSGAPETTDFHDLDPGRRGGEVDSGNALVVTATATGEATPAEVTVESIAVGQWTFEALTWDVASDADVEEFLAALRRYPEKSRTVIKYGLRGTVTLAQNQRLEEGLAEVEPIFAALYPRESTTDLHLAPGDQEIADMEVTGYAARALEELVAAVSSAEGASPDGTKGVDRDALNLMFRLSRES